MKVTGSSKHITKEVGLNVGRMLDQKGMTQAELARRSGVDRSHINKLLSGNRNVSIEILVKLANALDVPITRFFDGLDGASPEDLLQNPAPLPMTDYDVVRLNP